MKNKEKRLTKIQNQFISDYNKITKSNLSPPIKQEWVNKGDQFEKFTMYDSNYKIIPSLETIDSTTLIHKL
jgi:hypothetical protein